MSTFFLVLALLLAHPDMKDGADDCQAYAGTVMELLDAEEIDLDALPPSFQQALDCYGPPTDDTARNINSLFHNTINAYYDTGQHDEAFRKIDTFFEVFADHQEDDLFFRMHQWRGFIYFMRGEIDQSVQSYARSFAYTDDVAPEERAHVAEQIAILYERLQDYASARHFLQQAMNITGAADLDSERALWIRVRVLNTKSYLLISEAGREEPVNMENVERAADLAREVLELIEELPQDAEEGSARLRLAQAERYRGNFAAAEVHLREAYHLARALEEVYLYTAVAHNKGQLYLLMEEWDRARAALQEALDIAAPADYIGRAEALMSLGVVAEVHEDWQQAEAHYRASIEQHAIRRSILRTTEWAAMDRRWESAHRGLIQSFLAQERYDEAFEALDQARARYLQDVRLQTHVLGALSLEERAQYDELTAELASIRHELLSDTLSGEARARLLTEEARLLAARGAIIRLEDAPAPPSLEELQEALAEEDQVLLAYFIDTTNPNVPTSPRSHAFLLTPDTLIAEPLLATRHTLTKAIEQVSPLFAKNGEMPLQRTAFSLEVLHDLYGLLVGPVADHIPAGARLVVIPDAPLYSLPFGLLVTEPAPRFDYQSAHFLLRDHPISTDLSARLLLEERPETQPATLDVLAFGRQTFNSMASEDQARGLLEEASLPDLPAVRSELANIERLFRRVKTALDEEATEPALLAAIDRPAVLHLASHTVLDRTAPFRNGVILSPDPSDTTGFYDGYFHLHKLQGAPLPLKMVVLSGCDTALGAMLPGEGMSSLQYGFRTLGAESSVATLWLVDDKAMADLMELFYRNLRAGHPKDVALQRAQLAYLDGEGSVRSSPFFWAAPVLYGSPRPILLEARPFYLTVWFPYVITIITVLLAGGVMGWHRRLGKADE